MKKLLIIKLGALGDVVRTLPIAKALKKKYPDSEISWITKKESLPIVKACKEVDRAHSLPFDQDVIYDILYNFDLEEEATSLAMKIPAREKKGFYSQDNYPAAFNAGSEYYLNTLFDDELKKNNRKTYQQMMFEAADLEYNQEHFGMILSQKEKDYAQKFQESNQLSDKKLIGIHIGASKRWPSKVWHEDRITEFVNKVRQRDYEVLLLGGPQEIDKLNNLSEELKKKKITVYQNDPLNTAEEFASLVDLCDTMICSDSFAIHIALALKKPVIGLFFVTSPHEVEGYGLLQKAISPKLDEFFPQRSDEYNEELTKSISAEEVISLLDRIKTNKKPFKR